MCPTRTVPTLFLKNQYPADQAEIFDRWDRVVTMSIMTHRFCKATSIVEALSLEVVELLDKKSIGIGQLFKLLNARPKFLLHEAGRNEDGGLWRIYSLHCDGLVTCNIRKDFSPEASNWCIQPKAD